MFQLVLSGFKDLDYQTSGFQPSDLILIAARPSMGKTAFVLNIAQYFHAAVAEVADLVIGPDQSAQSRFLGHNIGVFLNIGGAKIRIQDMLSAP